MAGPLLGGGGGGNNAMLPLMMAAMMQPQTPPAPAQAPMGSPDQFKSGTSAGSPSFVSAATTAPQQQNLGGKTLLGQ